MPHFIDRIGHASIGIFQSLRENLFFIAEVIIKMFSPKTYNSATRMVLVSQIYFTSVQILPLFLTVSIIFGSISVGMVFEIMKNLGLADYMGRVLMGFVVTELSPFVTVLLIALRSGSAINTEMAVMKVNREIRTLEVFNIDVIDYLFIPRIVNGIVSVVLLSGLFSIVVLSSGLIFSKVIFGMGITVYSNTILNSATLSDIIILIAKCATFGFFITLIPIRYGMHATNELTSIPVSVLNGMVKVFIAIIVIEVLSSILRFI